MVVAPFAEMASSPSRTAGGGGPLDTPEFRLLLCCARRDMTPEYRQEIRTLLRSDIQWDRLFALATRHKMLPLVWANLQADMSASAPRAAQTLQRAFMGNASRMLRLSGELLELTTLLGGRGITVVPYKGPALGAYLYGNLAFRQAGDLDLLVRPRDVGATRDLLLERGYRPRHALSEGGAAFMLRSRYSEEWDREQGMSVELHWRFTNGDVGLPLDLDVLAPRLRTMPLGGGVVSTFGREDLLLILCIHGCKHRWDRLEWLCGVAELLRASSHDLDWSTVLDRATALGVRRMLLLGVLLAHDLLDAPVPEPFVQRARADHPVSTLATRVPALLVADAEDADDAGNLGTDAFRFQLRERWRDRVRFLWYRVTTPSRPESWSAVAVGKHWLPVHGFRRPFQILVKLLPALRQHRLAMRRKA
jgi:hypothetical protein